LSLKYVEVKNSLREPAESNGYKHHVEFFGFKDDADDLPPIAPPNALPRR
jgi:hypothetical protein